MLLVVHISPLCLFQYLSHVLVVGWRGQSTSLQSDGRQQVQYVRRQVVKDVAVVLAVPHRLVNVRQMLVPYICSIRHRLGQELA